MIDLSVESVTDKKPTFVPEPLDGSHVVVPGDSTDALAAQASFYKGGVQTALTMEREPMQQARHPYPDDMLQTVVDQMRRDVERFPASPRVWADLGLALLNAGTLTESRQAFRKALELNPRHVVALEGQARAETLLGDNAVAAAAYGRLHAAHPRNIEGLLGLAKLAFQQGKRDEALRLWQQTVKVAPNSALPRVYGALGLLEMGKLSEAIASLRDASRLDEQNAVVYHNLGVAYLRAEKRDKAEKAFRTALTLAPGMPESTLALAQVLLNENRIGDSIRLLQRYVADRPEDHQVRETLAWAYIRQNAFREAKSQLYAAFQTMQRQGITDDSHRERLTNNLAVCYWLLGDLDEARKMFESSIRVRPNGERIPYHNLARLYLMRRQLMQAREVIDRCLQISPNDSETQLLLAVSLEQQGRFDEALAEVQQMVNSGSAPAEAYGMLGVWLTDFRHDPDTGVRVLEEAHRLFPVDAMVVNNLAYAYLMQHNPAAARKVLDGFTAAVSGLAEIVLSATRGLLRLLEGDFEDAKSGYSRAEQVARRLGKNDLISLIQQKRHLEFARAYLRAGDVRNARQEVQAGLARSGSEFARRDLLALQEVLQMRGH